MDEATREALREAALVLDESDAGAAPSGLAPLGDRLTDTRIVGLGTPVEQSREAWEIQERILRYLVAERDLGVICLDAEFTAVEPLDAYVTGEFEDIDPDRAQLRTPSLHTETDCCDSVPPGCYRSSVSAGDTTIRSESLENNHSSPYEGIDELLQWLRRINTDRAVGSRIHLYGLGSRDPAAAVDRLRSYLDRVDPAFLETVRHNLDIVAGLDSPPRGRRVAEAGDVVDRAASAAETAGRKAAIREADRLLPTLRDRLTDHRSEDTSTAGHDARERAEQSVVLLEQAVSLQRPLQQAASGVIEREEAVRRFCRLDALAKADTLDWILGVEDATSVAVLARNPQVARTEQEVTDGGVTAELLGSLLAARYSDSYYGLGSEVNPDSGPAIEYGGPARSSDAPPSETVPEGLASLDAPAAVLDVERARSDERLAAWLADSEFADAFDGYAVLSGSTRSDDG